jgi:hypothetical protein
MAPAMVRDLDNKATKIAFKILGKPQNMQSQETKKEYEIEKRLAYEDTRLVR